MKDQIYAAKFALFGSFAAQLNNKESDIDMLYELYGGKRLGHGEINRKKN